MSLSRVSLILLVTVLSSATELEKTVEDSPQQSISAEDTSTQVPSRQAKAINFFNLAELTQPKDEENQEKPVKKQRQNKALIFDEDDFDFDLGDNYEDDDPLSRTIPSRRKQNPYKNGGNTNSLSYDNSPIYYILLPPTPYMYVPGLGYISQPPSLGPPVPSQVNPFINIPIDFVSNGKPTNVYQWAGGPSYQQPAAVDPYGQVFSKPVSRPQVQRPNDFGYQKPAPSKKPASDSKVTNLKKGPYLFNGKPHDTVYLHKDPYNSYANVLQSFYP